MFEEPESMDELIYYTRRSLGEAGEGNIVCWVSKEKCPQCKTGLMSKPKDEKTGKPKIRAKEYVCPSCNNTVEKEEYESTLTAKANYKCPECGTEDSGEVPFKRKNIDGVPTLRFVCSKCKANLDVTKKMKEKKKK
ncbi:MAG: hypothetical protein ABII01_02145 [Candidatus Woesearchaeota archaeon]